MFTVPCLGPLMVRWSYGVYKLARAHREGGWTQLDMTERTEPLGALDSAQCKTCTFQSRKKQQAYYPLGRLILSKSCTFVSLFGAKAIQYNLKTPSPNIGSLDLGLPTRHWPPRFSSLPYPLLLVRKSKRLRGAPPHLVPIFRPYSF